MTFYGPQSCSLPACKGSKLRKFQTPSPTCTLGPRQLPQQAPQGQGPGPGPRPLPQQAPQGHFPNRHATARAKATSPTGTPGPGHSNGFLRLSKLPFASPQTLQNSPNPPNAPNPPKPAKPSKHRPQQAPQIHSNDFLDAFKAAVCQPAKAATPLKFQTPSLTGGQGHSNDFLWASKLQFASLQRIQTSKIPNTFPNMHPRAKATSPTGTPGPGHSNGFLRLSKLPFASPQTLQNSPNPPNAPNPPKPAKPSKHRPQQAPQTHSNDFLDAFKAAVCQPAKAATPLKFQTPSLTGGQGHSNDFLWASKLQFASLQRIQTSKIPNTFHNMHPRAKATSPTGTPGPGHSNGFLRLSKLPFASPQTLQNSPNAPNPPKPAKPSKHRPQQAPQIHSNDFLDAFKAALTGGQGHSNDFLWASKLQFASLQRIQTSKIPNTFPNMHPRAKATSPTGTPGPGHSNGFLWAFKAGFLRLSKLPFASPQTLQNSPNPPNAPNPPKPAKPSKHRPQQAPQIHSNYFLDAFKAAVCQPAKAATPLKFQTPSLTGGQGHSNDFLWASKLQFASLQRIQTSKIPNTFPNMHPRAKATSPTGTPGPGHSNGFLRLSKLPFASPQTLQNSPNPPNAPNPPKPAKPSKHRPQQAPQIHSNDFLDAFKAAVCQPAKAATPLKFQTPSLTGGQGHSNDFLWASKLQFASLQRIQTSKIPNTFPNMHPRAKATSPTGTPGPGHSNGFLWAFKAAVCQPANPPKLSKRSKRSKPSKTRQTLQTPSPAGTSDPQQ